jgi:hypothetical protein
MSECLRELGGAYLVDEETNGYVVPDGEDFCFVLGVDGSGETADPNDDADDECSEDGFNLQIRIAHRAGMWVRSGTRYTASCSEAPDDLDCSA